MGMKRSFHNLFTLGRFGSQNQVVRLQALHLQPCVSGAGPDLVSAGRCCSWRIQVLLLICKFLVRVKHMRGNSAGISRVYGRPVHRTRLVKVLQIQATGMLACGMPL